MQSYWIRRAGWAVLPALMLCLPAAGMAKDPASSLAGEPALGPNHPATPPRLPGAEPTDGAIVPGVLLPTKLSDYWLGIECYPVPPAMQSQLNLPREQGLVVESIVPGSPAAKAGVKPYDILMKVGGKPLKSPADLIQAVAASKDKEMKLEVLRGGKPLKIEATPARRPEGEAAVPHAPGAGEADWDTVQKWLEDIRQHLGRRSSEGKEGEMPPLRFRFLHPGAILPPASPMLSFPANTTVKIERQGQEPAKITVTRDKDKWEITENELEKLPADLRPYVEQALGRGAAGAGAARRSEAEQPGATLERRMDLMNRRIEQLQKSINEMRDRLPKQVEERMERLQKLLEERRDRMREKVAPQPREEKPSQQKPSEQKGI